jgi:DNA helicase-2/ATP-dependent DNA helicase PcrA
VHNPVDNLTRAGRSGKNRSGDRSFGRKTFVRQRISARLSCAAPDMNPNELLQDLTDAQQAAVTTISGPLLVVAAAGSGKTRVLTRRVAYLISQGVMPGGILAITFTNKAAGEMRSRVSDIMSRSGGRPLRDFGRLEPYQPTVCTFHSLCMRIIRQYGPNLGISATSIFDTGDQQKLVKDALKQLDLSATNFAPGAVLSAISNAKNLLQTPDAYSASARDFFQRNVARVYVKYQALLDAQNAMDFDDLLMKVVLGFKKFPEVLRELQDRFEYLMVDEYQDTNHAQYLLTHLLAMRHRNLCVVGDPDQSIYAWRGADLRNILDFKKDYPDAREVRLENNYRSTGTILAVADKLIKNNLDRIDKQLLTENPDGEKVQVVLCQDEHDEAAVVVEAFRKAAAAGRRWGEMAVFYRMNSLSRVMEDALRRAGIPYVMARGVEFYNRKEIKDVLSYLRVLSNPLDEVSLDRVLGTPSRGLGDTSVRKIQTWGITQGLGLWHSLCNADGVPGLSSRARNAVRLLVQQITAWREMAGYASAGPPGAPALSPLQRSAAGPEPDQPPEDIFAAFEATLSDPSASSVPVETAAAAPEPARTTPTVRGQVAPLIERVIKESGLEALYAKESKASGGGGDTGSDPLGNINELISAAVEFDKEYPEGTLDDYLTQVALVSDTDSLEPAEAAGPGSEGGGGGTVTLMTLHAAKGLEFPVVAMIGWEDGVLPHSRARGDVTQMEEERRLAFVGITRAMEQLILTKAAYRTIRGLRERTVTSPFLGELPPDRLDLVDRAGVPTIGLRGLSAAGSGPSPSDLRAEASIRSPLGRRYTVGMNVRHPVFGLGKVAELSGTGQNTRCVVDFASGARKTLVLEYARLEIVG